MQGQKPHLDIRPWGEELWMTQEPPSMVKVISVKPNQALSLQYHKKRSEFWLVLEGSGEAQVGEQKIPIKKGDTVFTPIEEKHRIISGENGLTFLELTYGEFDENDIVRLEDRYGRVS